NLLLSAVTRCQAVVKHIPRPVSRFVLGGISTRSFKEEWARYVKARETLRSLYFPQGRPDARRHPVEFLHRRRRNAADRRLARRAHARPPLRNSPLFRVYDRLMLSQSSRTANLLWERLEGRLDAQRD